MNELLKICKTPAQEPILKCFIFIFTDSKINNKPTSSPALIVSASQPSLNLLEPVLSNQKIAVKSNHIPPSSSFALSDSNTNRALCLRPILGAQSAEDARKLLAMSQQTKRLPSQKRIPSFTFPNQSIQHHYIQPHHLNPLIQHQNAFGSSHTHSHVHNPHHQQYFKSANIRFALMSSPKAKNVSPNHPNVNLIQRQMVNPIQNSGAILGGSKAFLLDNLIPMPSRIHTSGGSGAHPNQVNIMNQRYPIGMNPNHSRKNLSSNYCPRSQVVVQLPNNQSISSQQVQ